MNNHFATRLLNEDGSWKSQMNMKNTTADIAPTAAQMPRLLGLAYASKLYRHNPELKYLKDFSTDAKQVQLLAYGNLGDAQSELNQKDEAIASYKKAASIFETDEANSAEYLFRAALLSETTGKTKEALEIYKELKAKFPKTDKGFQADKYIYRLSIEKSE